MVKKYGLFIIACCLLTLMMFIDSEYMMNKNIRGIFPVIGYEECSLSERIVLERVEKLLPLLNYDKEEVLIAKREDVFKLKNLKPVELVTMMELENVGVVAKEELTQTIPLPITEAEEGTVTSGMEETMEETIVPTMFVPRTLQRKIDMETLAGYEALVQNFYTIDACAMVGSDFLDAALLAGVDLRVTKNSSQPQILIYHTHSQEGFADSIPGDSMTGIYGVGEHLAQILRDEYGYQVLHHDGQYDVESRNNAYSRALPDIVQILEENPSIEVVIDLHRDAVSEDYKLVMDLDGRPTARFMFFNGVSCTRKTGKIEYLENNNQLENLAFSFQMKKVSEEYYPGLTRKNYIHGYRYNMHLLPRTTLIELGAQNNTLEEAMNACDPIAHILDMVLSGA